MDSSVDDRKQILIVDDDENTRQTLALILGRKGYDVTAVGTGEEALSIMEAQFCHLALVDIRLPDIVGVDLLEPMGRVSPDTVVIVVTGHASLETAVEALNRGATAYITKPLDLDQVLATIREALEKQRLVMENQRLYEAAQRELAERIRAEEKTAQIQEQLFQSQKMEAVGRLAGGIAHDFNNLLTAIMGYAEMLLETMGAERPESADLREILKAGQRAASLTQQLLAFSRNQYIEPQILSLDALVLDMEKLLRRLIGEDIHLTTEMQSAPVYVKADPGQIEQVILNLVVNAREAMPGGGQITITVEDVLLDEGYCEIVPEARPGQFVCLVVIDTGVGMDKETCERIFEPFFTTKEHGTGLGLAVVYGIIRQHEGWINVYSEPGHGTAFRIYLPACSSGTARRTPAAIPVEDLQGQGQAILLVEDEELVRAFATRSLAQNGYAVTPARNVAEALRILESDGDRFDLVLSDVILPDQSGLQLVDQIATHRPDLPVLLSSGYTDHKSHWSAIRERNIPFLQKPYAMARLLHVVRDALHVRPVARQEQEPQNDE